MNLREAIDHITWDLKVNRGCSFDSLRAKLLLIEFRLEQHAHWLFMKSGRAPKALGLGAWLLIRFFGSIFQWLLCNSNLPGTLTVGRGLRLPHPQNIILAGFAEFGAFCTIYHNVSVAWNGFQPAKPNSPKIGDQVLVGAGAILLGDVTIGSNVLIGAGTVVNASIPPDSLVTGTKATIRDRSCSGSAAAAGSQRHLEDPYSIWR